MPCLPRCLRSPSDCLLHRTAFLHKGGRYRCCHSQENGRKAEVWHGRASIPAAETLQHHHMRVQGLAHPKP